MAEVLDDIRHAVRSALTEREARIEAVRKAEDDAGLSERTTQARVLLCRAVELLDIVAAEGQPR